MTYVCDITLNPSKLLNHYVFFDFSIKQYEAMILVNEIKRNTPRNILIIGAFKGLSTLIALDAVNPEAKIYCIDPFFDTYFAGDGYGKIYHQMVTQRDVGGQVSTIKGFATTPGNEVFELTKDNSMIFDPTNWFVMDRLNMKFDLIFIDGDHSFLTAINDFIKSLALLSDGGSILIHDICDRLWSGELGKLMDFIRKIPSLQLLEHKDGKNGMAVVRKTK